ncbi:unnamed protein product, partial [Musa acuminata subsp. malaccensis]
ALQLQSCPPALQWPQGPAIDGDAAAAKAAREEGSFGRSLRLHRLADEHHNVDEHQLHVVRGEVRAGSVGEQEGHGGAKAGGPRLRAADRRPGGVHLVGHVIGVGVVLGLKNLGAI